MKRTKTKLLNVFPEKAIILLPTLFSMPALSLTQKLKIKDNFALLTLHAPGYFKETLGLLPPGVTVSEKVKTYHQIHWFVKDKAQLEEEVNRVIALLKEGVTCWIYYPKGSSTIQTDLTRDKGWESLQRHKNLQWLSLISFNETWSAFAMRLKTAADEKKKETPKERPIAAYIDAAKKLVYLPDDFAAALEQQPRAKTHFETLSFSNKKEYVEWMVSAKREETRQTRVAESVDRLAKGWKNPANR